MCRVIAVSNQKGGVGKTVSCVNLGIGLAQEGKKVLLIDADPQGSLTISLGYEEPDEMEYSLATLMMNIVNDEKLNIEKTILHHKEGVDIIPANIELSAIEVSLVNAMSRELILRSMVDRLREFYDYIIIDCMPSLGMMTINALACADSVLIPVQAAYLPVKGLQQLIKTIGRVKKQLNPKLKIEGILLTMVDNRTNYARDISLMVYDTYSASIKVFGTEIPMSVRASEVSVEGGSIYSYDPKGKAAFAYMALTKEKNLIRVYTGATSEKRIDIIIKNYTKFIGIVDGYTDGLRYMIECEKESSHRQAAGDLGVRVQTGGMTSDPTARKAINNVITREALINCDFSGNVLDGVDQAQVYIRDAYILRNMRKDYNLFNSQLGILGTEKETFTKYLLKEKTISDIAEDQGITYESARQQMQKIKVRMKKQVKRFMDGQPGGIA